MQAFVFREILPPARGRALPSLRKKSLWNRFLSLENAAGRPHHYRLRRVAPRGPLHFLPARHPQLFAAVLVSRVVRRLGVVEALYRARAGVDNMPLKRPDGFVDPPVCLLRLRRTLVCDSRLEVLPIAVYALGAAHNLDRAPFWSRRADCLRADCPRA